MNQHHCPHAPADQALDRAISMCAVPVRYDSTVVHEAVHWGGKRHTDTSKVTAASNGVSR